MRILLTCKKRGWNGETSVIHNLAEGYARAGHEVAIAARNDSTIRPRARDLSIPVRSLDLEHGVTAVRSLIRDLVRLRSWLRDVDLVHTHASWDTWLVALARSEMSNPPPLVRSRHNLKRIRTTWPNRWLYGHSISRLVAVSEAVGDDLRRHPFIASNHVRVAQPGIHTDLYDPSRVDRSAARAMVRSKLGAPPDVPVVAFVSRLAHRKKPEFFLELSGRLVRSGSSAWFLLAGNMDYGSGARELLDKIDAQAPRVKWIGFQEDVPELLAGCDVLVLPAAAEPFGLAPVEAMAMTCPPVCVDAAGPRESVVDGETGYLCPVGNARAFAERIEALIARPELRARLGTAGRKRVLKHYTSEGMVRRHLEIYDELLGQPKTLAAEKQQPLDSGSTASGYCGITARRRDLGGNQ